MYWCLTCNILLNVINEYACWFLPLFSSLIFIRQSLTHALGGPRTFMSVFHGLVPNLYEDVGDIQGFVNVLLSS